MGVYTGRTQAGRIFPVMREYFNRMELNTFFDIGPVSAVLLKEYNLLNSDKIINNLTGIQDGIRTAALDGGFLRQSDQGRYKLIRKISPRKDAAWFQKNYYKKAAKGVKYKQLKEKEMTKDNTTTLTQLGSQNTRYVYDAPDIKILETFENKHTDQTHLVSFVQARDEFTSLCPVTNQPDQAKIEIIYVPNQKMVESKSLKLYLFSYRNHGAFHEDIVNRIAKDLWKVLVPKYLRVFGDFAPRGGIAIKPLVEKWEEHLTQQGEGSPHIMRLVSSWDEKRRG
jgi:7-cyano-7-deazaguanine reductase